MIVTKDQILKSYEGVRLAEMGHRGAVEYAAEALRDLETAKATHEVLVRNYNPEVTR